MSADAGDAAGDQPEHDQPTDETTAFSGGRVPQAQVFRWAIAGTAGALLMVALAYGVYVARELLLLIFVATFVAISLEPLIGWLVARGLGRRWSVAILVSAMVLVVGLFVWSVVPPLVEQGGRLLADLPEQLQRLSDRSQAVGELTDRFGLTEAVSAATDQLPGTLAGGAAGFVRGFFGGLASLGIVLGLAIYFMADLPRLRSWFVALFPLRRRARVAEIVEVVVDKVGSYMIGNIFVSLLAGVTSFVVLELVGVPLALPLAVIVAVTDLIPSIGATIGAAVCLLASVLTVGVWPQSVILLVFFTLYQQVENYVIVPRVMRSAVDMPSGAVLVVALLGGVTFGLVGAIMAIPIMAVVKVVLSGRFGKRNDTG